MAAGGNLAAISATPSFPVTTDPVFETISDGTVDGTRQSAVKVATVKTGFDLEYRAQTNTQKSAMDTFWSDNQGSYSGFTWVDPRTSTSYNVFFDPETPYKPVNVGPGLWEWSFTIKFRK